MFTLIIFFLFFIVGAIAAYVGFKNSKLEDFIKYVGLGLIGVAFAVLLFGSYKIIPAGTVGVKTFFGNVDNDVLQSGFHFINPITDVDEMNIRTQNYTMSSRHEEGNMKGNDAVSITMKDQSSPQMDLSVTFHLSPTEASKVYRTIGIDYIDKIVRPDIRSVVPRVATLFNSTDLYDNTQRTLFETLCKSQLDSIFHLRGVVLEDVKLREVVPSEEVQKAINAKIASQQEAQAMQFKLQKSQQEAEIRKVEAHGIDSSQAIIAHSLTSQYLLWEYYQTLAKIGSDGNMIIVTPLDGKAPILNIPSPKK